MNKGGYKGGVGTLQAGMGITAGQFTIDGASAVATQNPASTSVLVVTKPAGTGLYRITFAEGFPEILFSGASFLVAAGTADRCVDPVAETASTGVVDFQVRKKSDGTAVDPVSCTIKFQVVWKNSTVTP